MNTAELNKSLSTYWGGWKCRQEAHVTLVGEKGKMGCATVRETDRYYDVAIWWCGPKEVAAFIHNKGPCPDHDTRYVEIPLGVTPDAMANWIIDEVVKDRRYMEG